MNKEYLRLYNLWQENKLSKSEFKLLVAKIQSNTWLDILILWIFNPFARLTTNQALIIGSVLMVAISIIGYITGFHFPGIPAGEEILHLKGKLNFIAIFFEQIIEWTILSITFYLLAKISKASNIRLLDFFAYLAMAFVARFILSIDLYIIQFISPGFFINVDNAQKLMSDFPGALIILWITSQWLMYIWLYRLYFSAFELASGLTKLRLWTNFVTGMIISQTIYYSLANYLYH